MNSNELTLKPCPFCGGPASVKQDSLFGFLKTYSVRCLRCLARQRWQDSKEDAILVWNFRN